MGKLICFIRFDDVTCWLSSTRDLIADAETHSSRWWLRSINLRETRRRKPLRRTRWRSGRLGSASACKKQNMESLIRTPPQDGCSTRKTRGNRFLGFPGYVALEWTRTEVRVK